MISQETVDKILDAAQIIEVIGELVPLKRRGANYIACCPFHHEKTPSFSVSPSKGIYKCFGCGKAGNTVNFIMEHEHLSYPEALRYLARKYNIPIEETESSDEEKEASRKHESMILVSEFAQKFFAENMFKTNIGRSVALGYFKERGFTEESIRDFGLGYSLDDRESLLRAAKEANLNLDYLSECGLLFKTEDGHYFDKFYGRVMFPIHSVSGRVIAFGGRTLRTDKKVAKYINSPESDIYIKKKALYGISLAKSAIVSQDKCYLVEGYTDVISMHQAGIKNVVASCGTSLTEEQIILIKRFTSNVTILYDGDGAGISAAIRGIDMLLKEGMNIKVALIPDGDDPDSYAKAHSKDEILNFLDGAEEDFIDFRARLLKQQSPAETSDPIHQARLINDVIKSISLITDNITRTVYIKETCKKFELDEAMISSEVAKHIRTRQIELVKRNELEERNHRTEEERIRAVSDYRPHDKSRQIPDFVNDTYCEPAERDLIYYLLKFGSCELVLDQEMLVGAERQNLTVAEYILEELQSDDLEFKNLVYKNLFDEYFRLKEEDPDKIIKHFINHPDKNISSLVADLLIDSNELTIKQFRDSLIKEENVLGKIIPKVVMVYKAKVVDIAIKNVIQELGKASQEKDVERQAELLHNIKIMTDVKNCFAKELKRVTV